MPIVPSIVYGEHRRHNDVFDATRFSYLLLLPQLVVQLFGAPEVPGRLLQLLELLATGAVNFPLKFFPTLLRFSIFL